MKQFVLVGALVGSLGAGISDAQTNGSKSTAGEVLGTVQVTRRVLADGKPLAAGTYQVRLTNDLPTPAVGEAPNSERYVEFVRGGTVAGREVASVISADEIGKVAKGPRPPTNGSRVDLLKGGDYLRVWLNRGGTNYLVNMPPQDKAK
jgi:hypothetical protein